MSSHATRIQQEKALRRSRIDFIVCYYFEKRLLSGMLEWAGRRRRLHIDISCEVLIHVDIKGKQITLLDILLKSDKSAFHAPYNHAPLGTWRISHLGSILSFIKSMGEKSALSGIQMALQQP